MPVQERFSLTYRYKKHWIRPQLANRPDPLSVCGKRLPLWAFADTIPKITCKTCQRRFAYWNQEAPQ